MAKQPQQKIEAPPEYDEMQSSGEGEIVTQDEALAKIALILARAENKKQLSEVSDYETKALASLYAVAQQTDNRMLKIFLDSMLELRVSHKRKGREELMSVAKATRQQDESALRIRKMFSGWR
jgi:hypothetical protein